MGEVGLMMVQGCPPIVTDTCPRVYPMLAGSVKLNVTIEPLIESEVSKGVFVRNVYRQSPVQTLGISLTVRRTLGLSEAVLKK
jgi:hypothetical protein